MNVILRFFKGVKDELVLVILVFFGLFTFFYSSQYYHARFFRLTTNISGTFNASQTAIHSYFKLQSENKRLAEENAALRQNIFVKPSNVMAEAQKVVFSGIEYDVLEAQVIYNTTHLAKNYFVINQGLNHGVAQNMAVFSSKGIAGRVIEVTQNYSKVMSLLNKDFSLIPTIGNLQITGVLNWEGQNPNELSLSGISKHSFNDTLKNIYTSSASYYFPDHLPIGKIIDKSLLESGNEYILKIKPLTDFTNLKYVYVYGAKNIKELNNLDPI